MIEGYNLLNMQTGDRSAGGGLIAVFDVMRSSEHDCI